MPDLDGPKKETSDERRFMREKIVRQPLTRRQIARRALVFLFLAALFGVIAAVSFVVTRPIADKFFGKETTQESISISFTMDEPDTTPEPATKTQTETEEQETEPIEELLKSAVGKYKFASSDVDALYDALHTVVQDMDKGIVTVHSARQQTDWFGNAIENAGQFAGAVIAKANGELLILTCEAAVEDADAIRVTFSDGAVTGGQIKQTDKVLGLAVVTVSQKDVPEETLKNVQVLVLGNSYSVQQGDAVIGIGGPAGVVHSAAYGNISYVARNVQAVDGVARIFYADLDSNAQTGTFIANLSGEIVGWVTENYKNESNQNMTAIFSISDYKGILEKLTNGLSAPYFGVQGQEVNTAMVESGMPEGVYVVNAVANSPAYDAGIQNGDIITRVDEKEITTLKDLQTKVENMESGQVVSVTVERKGRDEYKEFEYQVNIRAR